jgi:hypothetical protein
MQYGVEFRPRQSMIINRFKALENYLTRANTVLAQYPISETRSFNLLNSSEPVPAQLIQVNAGSFVVGTQYTIYSVGTTDFTLIGAANNDVGTTFVATGAGTGSGVATYYNWNYEVATLEILAYQDLALVPIGYRYLVQTDSSQHGGWAIYQVVESTVISGDHVLNLAQVQNYDTPLYWNRINWYLPGYNSSIQPIATVANTAGLQTLSLSTAPVGSSVKVTANGQGKFEIYLRTATGWDRVGLEDGTIAFSEVLWNYPLGGFGFDSEVFDALFFDQEPVIETRQILRAINEELFVGDLLIERNQSLMLVFQFIYSEFTSPNWLVKTSYIGVSHVIRGLLPYQLYQPDNQTFVLDYLNEVKPYHVQNLAFNLIYDGLDTYQGDLTDYDVPAYWNTALDAPQFVSPILTPYTYSDSVAQSFTSDAAANAQIWLERPWSDWYNNYLLSIQTVTVVNGGSGYTAAPNVTVTGTCVSPAKMTAVINSAGQVTAIVIDDPGVGYSTTAVIAITGGGGSGAVATAQMGNGLVRSIRTTIKYDRYEYASNIHEWQANMVYAEGDQVRWSNRVWSSKVTQSTATFNVTQWTLVPADSLSGVDRTMGFYTPTANMPGLSLPLLIDGVEYPGVQVVATNYAVPVDLNTLDALYASAYTDTYLGTRPTDINVDGSGYIDVYSSYAPEELIPGSEFDTLDFRVYTTPGSDWRGLGHGFPAGSQRYVFDPASPVLNFAGILQAPMVVILFNATLGLAIEPLSYNWANYELTVNPDTATSGDTLVVYVTGTGGGNQLMTGTYLGSEMVNGNEIVVSFPTSTSPTPPVDSIYQFVIYNGETPLHEGTDYVYEAFGDLKTKITFANNYDATNRINLTALGYGYDGNTHSWSLPVFETIPVTDSAQLTYTLTNSLQGTNPVDLIVVVNGLRARPYEGARYVADGSTVAYDLPDRGGYSQSLISDNAVQVYLNNQVQILGVDFVVSPYVNSMTPRTITLLGVAPVAGTVVQITVSTAAQYSVSGNQLTFLPANGLSPQLGDIIEIITWNDTAEQGILTQVFVGPTSKGVTVSQGYSTVPFDSASVNNTSGSFDFTQGVVLEENVFDTGRVIVDPNRLLVTLNGNWLFNGIGYVVDGSNIVILGPTLPQQSVLAITSLTQSVVPDSMAFRIFQDMRGVQATYRITPATTTATTDTVGITDDIISVVDANALQEPDLANNVWGVVTIDAERIMYRYRDTVANTVSGLLRGTAGTAVAEHVSGAIVYNMGRGNLLPADYQNYIVSNSTLGDGSTTVFTAEDINTEFEDSTVIEETVEVYVGGIRVTFGYTFISNNPVSIQFDTAPAEGVDVTILVRRGVTWYKQGVNPPSASNGVPLQETDTPAARSLRGL